MAVNPSGICCVMTMPGISAGSCFKTARVASVPPVDAPSAMTVDRNESCLPANRGFFGAVVVEAAVDVVRLREAHLTFANEAMWILEFKAEKNCSLETIFISGFLTKSTAPAESTSNTFRFREDTRTTGIGCRGRKSFKKSIPFNPGISTSIVITSGFKSGIFFGRHTR